MRKALFPTLCATSLLAGCCLPPNETGADQPLPTAAPAAAPAAPPAAAAAVPAAVGAVDAAGASAAGAGAAKSAEAAAAVAAPSAGAASAAAASGASAAAKGAGASAAQGAAAAVPVGALLAGGSQYAYEDLGITLTVPSGWTQQLMRGNIVALFSPDYPSKGKRDRGAMMLVSTHKGTLPADDKKLAAALKEGLDPSAQIEAGPIRIQIADKQAAQVVAKATGADGAPYRALHTILQSGNKAVSVKSTTFDSLDSRKPVFDAVMESISFSGAPAR